LANGSGGGAITYAVTSQGISDCAVESSTGILIFFHPEGERGPARENRIALAKSICATCPVLRQCAEHALAVREPYGVWGAMSEDDRETIYAPVKAPMPIAG